MKYILFSLITFASLMLVSCSPETSINGNFYHFKGQQKYYTLTISAEKGNQILKFEGVPLDLMQNLPWNYTCTGKGRGNTIKCDKIVVNFDSNNQIAHVKYGDGKQQVFISSKQQIEEETTKFDQEIKK